MTLMNVFPNRKLRFRMNTNAKTFGRILRCFTIGFLWPLGVYGALHLTNCSGYFQSRLHTHTTRPQTFNGITVKQRGIQCMIDIL